MSIRIECPQCRKVYDVSEDRAGQTGKCICGTEIKIVAQEQIKQTQPNMQRPVNTPTPRPPWLPPQGSIRQRSPYGFSSESEPDNNLPTPYGPHYSQSSKTTPLRPYEMPTGSYNNPSSRYGSYYGPRPYGTPGAMSSSYVSNIPNRPLALSIMVVLTDIAYIYGGISIAREYIYVSSMMSQMGLPFNSLALSLMIACLVVVMGTVLVCQGLWDGRYWARITMIILLWIHIVMILHEIGSLRVMIVFIADIVFLIILNTPDTKEYCSQ